MKNSLLEKIKTELHCPITTELLKDPVFLVQDGTLYSREALLKWLSTCRKSPITQENIDRFSLEKVRAINNILEMVQIAKIQPKTQLPPLGGIFINVNKERARLMNRIEKVMLEQNCVIFGSRSYRQFLQNGAIIAFYKACRRDNLNADLMYHNLEYHPDSAAARNQTPGDLDVYGPRLSIRETLRTLALAFPCVTIQQTQIHRNKFNPNYDTSFRTHYELMTIQFGIKLGCSKDSPQMRMRMDLVTKRIPTPPSSIAVDDLKVGAFPNIWKCICKTSSRFFLREYAHIPPDHQALLLEGCKRLFDARETMTTHFEITKGDGFVNRNDIGVYLRRLYYEIHEESVCIINLSVDKNNEDQKKGLRFNLFDRSGRRLSSYDNFTLEELNSMTISTEESDWKRGQLKGLSEIKG